MKHTKLPWRTGNNGQQGGACQIIDADNRPVCSMNSAFMDDCENAEFIVTACNKHSDLVNILEAIKEAISGNGAIDRRSVPFGTRGKTFYKLIDQALAKES